MPTRGEIRDWVRQQTLVESDDFSDAKLNTVLDQGIREIAMAHRWPFLEASTTFQTTEDVAGYPFPSDFARLEAVYFDGGDPLVETTRRDAQKEFGDETASEAERYYFWQEQINLAPIPNVAFVDVNVDYQREPTLLANDTDVPEFHSAFHMILAEYGAAKVWEREEDLERSAFHARMFARGVRDMIDFYSARGKDDPIIFGENTARVRTPWSWQRD